MIKEQAIVKKIQGDHAIVELGRDNGCQGCELSAACGTGSLGKLLGFRLKPLSIVNDNHLKPGDRVIIGLPEKSYLSACFLIYLLPLICLFIFALLADIIFGSRDGLNVLAAMVGLLAGIFLSAWFARQPIMKSVKPHFICHHREPRFIEQV